MFHSLARELGLGRLLYWAWFAPKGLTKRITEQGVINLALARAGEVAMRRASARLVPLSAPTDGAPEVYFLTGRRFAHQTAFCAMSLCKHAGRTLKVVVVDDGTITRTDLGLLNHLFPGLRVVLQAEVERRLQRRLPKSTYPELRRRRLAYPHLRKLTDVHALGDGWKLVLDSDMLFHARPEFVLNWLSAPDRPCHMVDVADAYGYSSGLLRELNGVELPSRVNVGLCGLHSDDIDWAELERWCQELISREGPHYLMEQALVAMLMTRGPRAVAPLNAYIVAPTRAEVERPTAVLHHYTAASKTWYFRFGWRHLYHSGGR